MSEGKDSILVLKILTGRAPCSWLNTQNWCWSCSPCWKSFVINFLEKNGIAFQVSRPLGEPPGLSCFWQRCAPEVISVSLGFACSGWLPALSRWFHPGVYTVWKDKVVPSLSSPICWRSFLELGEIELVRCLALDTGYVGCHWELFDSIKVEGLWGGLFLCCCFL